MAEEELRARAVLAEMQMRISQGPHCALSISEEASAEEVRQAFLQLTKQFHPARFGRMSAEVHRLANEVFLGIKGAHDQLTKALGSSGRVAPRSSTGVPVANSGPSTMRGTGLVPKTQPLVSALTRGTDRSASRQSSPAITPPGGSAGGPPPGAGQPRAASPLVTPAGGNRMSTQPQSTQPLPRPTPALGIPIQRPHTGEYTHRPTTPQSGDVAKRPTPPSGIPAQPRPTSPLPTTARPPTPAHRTPAPDPVTPPTVRYSGAAPKAGASSENTELQRAMDLLTSKDWTAARLAFHALAAKLPQSRQYRALLCYARGRETQATGRADDAVMEFQRALQLDPDLQIAKDAIREVGRKSRW